MSSDANNQEYINIAKTKMPKFLITNDELTFGELTVPVSVSFLSFLGLFDVFEFCILKIGVIKQTPRKFTSSFEKTF